jgi:pimeloyl-ACP methyl ester carboxylesterase
MTRIPRTEAAWRPHGRLFFCPAFRDEGMVFGRKASRQHAATPFICDNHLPQLGDKDPLCSQVEQEALRSPIRGSRLVVHTGSGHSPHWEDPQRPAADIAAFASTWHDTLASVSGVPSFGALPLQP